MKNKSISNKTHSKGVLGMEGGGTKTGWSLVDKKSGRVLLEGVADQGNTLLLSDEQLVELFQSIAAKTGKKVLSIGGAFASCYFERERQRITQCMKKVWPKADPIVVTGDSEAALISCHGHRDGICVIAGTGSNIIAQYKGKIFRAGGWGHLFSDHGSGYDLARRALEAVYLHYNQTEEVSLLGQILLRTTAQNSLEDLVPWMLQVQKGKSEIAALAPCVFEAAEKGDVSAKEIIREGAFRLAEAVGFLIKRLRFKNPSVGLVGGLFEKGPAYEENFRKELKKIAPRCRVFLRETSGAVAAASLASRFSLSEKKTSPQPSSPLAVGQSLTEQRNPRSHGLQKKTTLELVRLFTEEEWEVINALQEQESHIVEACDLVANSLKKKGRLFYIGAGTSGRLGIVDASEMPPTFNAPPDQVQAIIAGGAKAVFSAQEGAEDDREAGKQAIHQRGLRRGDVLCGIAASGHTPFVLGALEKAHREKIATILISCNPGRPDFRFVDVGIDLPAGPELITGSTRLKAGTVTKLVLNMLSTIAMIRLGRVYDNLMIDVQATNGKLRDRAKRLVMELLKCREEQAHQLLKKNRWSVRQVVGKKLMKPQ